MIDATSVAIDMRPDQRRSGHVSYAGSNERKSFGW